MTTKELLGGIPKQKHPILTDLPKLESNLATLIQTSLFVRPQETVFLQVCILTILETLDGPLITNSIYLKIIKRL